MTIFRKLKDLTPAEIMKREAAQKWMQHHGKPVTRRQMLGAGLIAGGAYMVMPSLLTLLSEEATAQSACGSTGMPAFITLNLDGGGCLAANVIALDAGGQMLQDYGAVGLGTTPTPVQVFGETGPSFASISSFMTGLQTGATATTLANTAMFTVAVQSQDDSATTTFDPTPMVVAANSQKTILPPLGTNRNAPAVLPPTPTLNVQTLSDIQNAVTVNGAIASLTMAQKATIFQNIQNLTALQAANLANVSGASLLGALAPQATTTNTNLISGQGGVIDPSTVATLKTAWGNFTSDSNDLRDAAVVANVLQGNALAGYCEMGGFDYHGTGAQNVAAKDTSAGLKVGHILQTAATMAKPMFLVVTTDGSTASPYSSTPQPPSGDKGTHGMLYVFAYSPTARPVATSNQLGAYTFGGTDIGVDTSTAIGGSPANAIAAIIANYMNWSGQANAVANVINNALTGQQITDLTILQVSAA